jgi:hypothetical protein
MPDLTAANPRYAEINVRVGQYLSQSTDDAILSGLADAELQKTTPAPGAH